MIPHTTALLRCVVIVTAALTAACNTPADPILVEKTPPAAPTSPTSSKVPSGARACTPVVDPNPSAIESPPIWPAEKLKAPKPKKPDDPSVPLPAEVVLEATIEPDGTVCGATVTKPVSPAFDEAAIVAVSQWRFAPATTLEGQLIASRLSLTVRYFPDPQ